jgi:hypothetical protein
MNVLNIQDISRSMVIENEKQLQQLVVNINKTKNKVFGKKILKKKRKANLQLFILFYI